MKTVEGILIGHFTIHKITITQFDAISHTLLRSKRK